MGGGVRALASLDAWVGPSVDCAFRRLFPSVDRRSPEASPPNTCLPGPLSSLPQCPLNVVPVACTLH